MAESYLMQTTFINSTTVADRTLWENLGEVVIVRCLRSMMWKEVQKVLPLCSALAVLDELG